MMKNRNAKAEGAGVLDLAGGTEEKKTQKQVGKSRV
jgi:hypothetical protein